MINKVLVFHTRFQYALRNSLRRPYSISNRLFGDTEVIAQLKTGEYPIQFIYRNFEMQKVNYDVILISDELFGVQNFYNKENLNEQQIGVKEALELIINDGDELNLFYHINDRYTNTITTFFEDFYPNQTKFMQGYRHEYDDSSPFFVLVNLINSLNDEEYNTSIQKLISFIPDQDVDDDLGFVTRTSPFS